MTIGTPLETHKLLSEGYNLLNRDPAGAVAILEPLAQSGSAQAMVYLGYACRRLPSSGNFRTTGNHYLDWFEKAYSAGSREGRRLVGIFNFREGNLHRAEEAFRDGVGDGDLSCKYWLACLFLSTHKDSEEAMELLEEAARLGHEFARGKLGRLLASGRRGFLARFRGLILIVRAALRGYRIAHSNKFDVRLK